MHVTAEQMPEPILCPECKIWPLGGCDRYCAFCGYGVAPVARIYLDDAQADMSEVAAMIRVRNRGPDAYLDLSSLPSWLAITDLDVLAVRAGAVVDVPVAVLVEKLGGAAFQDGALRLATSSRAVVEETLVSVRPVPQPRIEDATIQAQGGAAEISVFVRTLAPLVVCSATFDPPVFTLARETFIDVGKGPLPVRLADSLPPGVCTVRYALRAEGIATELTGSFQLTVRHPPHADIGDHLDMVLVPGETAEGFIPIRNSGGEELVVEAPPRVVKFSGDHAEGVDCVVERKPLTIAPGTSTETLRVTISAGLRAAAGQHRFTVQLRTNDPRGIHEVGVEVEVCDEPLDEYLAMDFGTIDSAVAHFQADARPSDRLRNLPLEGPYGTAKILSNIFFLTCHPDDQPPFEWLIGVEAKKYGTVPNYGGAIRHTQRRESMYGRYIKTVKTLLGTAKMVHVDIAPQPLPPEEIASYIICDLLRRARERLKKRPTHVALCNPTRFTLRQRAALRRAFHAGASLAGLEKPELLMLDESLAAGAYYLMVGAPRNPRLSSRDTYTLLVLDIGGGSSDATLFRVHQALDRDGQFDRIESVEVVGAWGDASLGGEDITGQLATQILERMLKRRIDEEQDWRLLRAINDEAEAAKLVVSLLMELERKFVKPEDRVQGALSREYATLRDNIEKLVLNTLSDDDYREFIHHYLSSEKPQQPRKFSFAPDPFPPRCFPVLSGDPEFINRETVCTEAEVVALFTERLESLRIELELLLAKCGCQQADAIVLAGQTSLFPLVRDAFEPLAKTPDDITYVTDELDRPILKECVSRGAVILTRAPFELDGDKRLWLRLGWLAGGVRYRELLRWGASAGQSERFSLTPADLHGETARVDVMQNLSLTEDDARFCVHYARFVWSLPTNHTRKLECWLEVDEHGDVQAFCSIGDKPVPGEMQG